MKKLAFGIVTLNQNQQSEEITIPYYRKAIFCRTGVWKGAEGDVEITKEMLETIGSKYNAEREKVINENDYAPIQINHDRDNNLTMGRIDISRDKLVLEPASKYLEGDEGWVLVGPLRIDDLETAKNVAKGKFAHLSIQFDDEDSTLYEISFVSVEAARRSIVLNLRNEGENNVTLEATKKRVRSLESRIIGNGKKVTSLCMALAGNTKTGTTSLSALLEEVKETKKELRTTSLNATFDGFVLSGKLSKKERDTVEVDKLVDMDTVSLGYLLKSYENRPVDKAFLQSGVSGQTPIGSKDLKQLSPEKMREAVKLEMSGKKVTSLGSTENGEEDVEELGTEEVGEDGKPKEKAPEAMGAKEFESVDKTVERLSAIEKKVEELSSSFQAINDLVDQIKSESKTEDIKGEE